MRSCDEREEGGVVGSTGHLVKMETAFLRREERDGYRPDPSSAAYKLCDLDKII